MPPMGMVSQAHAGILPMILQLTTVTPLSNRILQIQPLTFWTPEDLLHPHSSEWSPAPKVAAHIYSGRLGKPLDTKVRSRLRAECPRPALEGKVTERHESDPKMTTFLAKFLHNAKKGIDRSWRSCQDKLLHVAGALSKILDITEDAKTSSCLILPDALYS
ncbi:hypothetical protein NDU88_006232 [Pleurodeles waltl]|uniref:Uncharacterized protein n=1 Tax=Pleurodeles waltl TaxID=8319 RepID=A0AAV7WEZ0_PLEWA|nr:hypothetical protein NDU88_006232 [Pleurodeles waltl]